MKPKAFILLLTLWPCAHAAAQPAALTPPDPQQPTVVELLVVPAPEPRPALKYSLLPTPAERTPGNAATHYYRAMLIQKERPKEYWQEYSDKHQLWLAAAPGDETAKAELGKWLAPQRNVLEEVRLAAFRERCDWDIRLQDLRGLDAITFLLPEIQECRTLARTIQLQAHYELLDGRPDDALQTLCAGYQLARDTAQPPNLICGLVGVAIGSIMNDELLVLIRQSDANYYWALAALPEPLVDLRPAMQFEMNLPLQMFPFLKDAETAQRSQGEWRRMMIECLQGVDDIDGGPRSATPWRVELFAAGLVAKLYPLAKEQLLAEGLDRQRIEEMPVAQVVAIQTSRSLKYAFQEVFKLSHLPYHDAIARMPATLERLEAEGHLHGRLSGREGLPLTSLLLPAVSSVLQAEVRMARNLAALQTIEALRMQAAASGGKLPASLADVTIVPVPKNPATGQPFTYTLDTAAGAAAIDVPPLGGLTPQQDGKRYVIRLKGK